MNTKALVGIAALVLAATGTAKAQQLMVYDAHNRVVGRYESNGAPVNPGQLGEGAIRQINGVWLALPITGDGFVNNVGPRTPEPNPLANADQTDFSGAVYWSGPNCTGTPWLERAADVVDVIDGGQLANQPAAPLVQNAIVLNGVAYYAQPAVYGIDAVSDPQPPTICSIEAVSGIGPFCAAEKYGCAPAYNMMNAVTYNLANLGFTPPFSVR